MSNVKCWIYLFHARIILPTLLLNKIARVFTFLNLRILMEHISDEKGI